MTSIYGMNAWRWNQPSFPMPFKAIKAAGVTHIRRNLYVNKPDEMQTDWDTARQAGLEVLPILVWCHDDFSIAPPPPEQEWCQAVAGAITRYPARAFEVWNEPNLTQFWTGSPEAFARLVTATHEVAAGRTVISGGLAANTHHDWFGFLTKLVRAGMQCDAVGLHPYERSPEVVSGDVAAARRQARKPVWITEMGWATAGPRQVTEQRQAWLLSNAYARLHCPVFWFCWQDDPELDGRDAYARAGLVRADGSEKPALGAFKRAVKR